MHDIRTTVAVVAPQLKPGQTIRQVCPVCCAEHEKSFSIRRDAHDTHRIWFRCWRVKCGVTGSHTDAAGLLLSVVAETPDWKTEVPRLEKLPSQLSHTLGEQLDLPITWDYTFGVKYHPMEDTIWYPWMNKTGLGITQVGWQVRGATTKTFRMEQTATGAHHYTIQQPPSVLRNRVVIVENAWSAYKVASLEYLGIALFGHGCSQVVANHLRARLHSKYEDVLVLLDADTWPKKVTAVMRNLEAAGFKATAKFTEQKPHQLSQEDLQLLITGHAKYT